MSKPVEIDVRGSELLRRVITLLFERATVGNVLTAIEQQIGVKFIYSRVHGAALHYDFALLVNEPY